MRILHVLDHSIPLQSGYTFRTLSILTQQRAMGWETVHLTTPKHTRPFQLEETVDGWHFYRTPAPGRLVARLPVLAEWAQMRSTAIRLAEVAQATRPDIIHAHSPVLNALPALKVGRRLGLPVVYEVRAFWEDAAASHGTSRPGGARYRLTKAIETHALRRADAVTTICEGLKRDIIARGIAAERVTVIPNAVNLEEFAGAHAADEALAAGLGLAGKEVLGFLGSFYSYEGLALMIAALPRILDRRPGVRLLLVGGGPEDERLRAQAAASPAAHAVIFTGRVPHDQVSRYYDLVDVLVYPRLSMRLTELVTPLKPLEAMAEQKIVVASDVGGHRELIRDGETGYLFKAGDEASLAETVERVLAARAVWPRVREAGRRYVETERNWQVSVANYRPVYEALAGAGFARRAAGRAA